MPQRPSSLTSEIDSFLSTLSTPVPRVQAPSSASLDDEIDGFLSTLSKPSGPSYASMADRLKAPAMVPVSGTVRDEGRSPYLRPPTPAPGQPMSPAFGGGTPQDLERRVDAVARPVPTGPSHNDIETARKGQTPIARRMDPETHRIDPAVPAGMEIPEVGPLDMLSTATQTARGAFLNAPTAIGEQVFGQSLPGHEGEGSDLMGRLAAHANLILSGQGGQVAPIGPVRAALNPPDTVAMPTNEADALHRAELGLPEARVRTRTEQVALETGRRGMDLVASMLTDPTALAAMGIEGPAGAVLGAAFATEGVTTAAAVAGDPNATPEDVAEAVLGAAIAAGPLAVHIARPQIDAAVRGFSRGFREWSARRAAEAAAAHQGFENAKPVGGVRAGAVVPDEGLTPITSPRPPQGPTTIAPPVAVRPGEPSVGPVAPSPEPPLDVAAAVPTPLDAEIGTYLSDLGETERQANAVERAGPERRSADRVRTSEEDRLYAEYREKLAKGETAVSPAQKTLLDKRQKLDDYREQAAIDEVSAPATLDKEIEQTIADLTDTGEAQPRLPGASGARQVGKADVTFKAPQQASGSDFALAGEETPDAKAAREQAERGPDLLAEPEVTPEQEGWTSKGFDPKTLTIHERRELGRMLKELENIPFTKHSFIDDVVGKGGSMEVIGGAGGAPVFNEIGGTGSRADIAQAIRDVLAGKTYRGKVSANGNRAIQVARNRVLGDDPALSRPMLPLSAGDEPGVTYVNLTPDMTPEESAVERPFRQAVEQRTSEKVAEYIEKFGNVVDADKAKQLAAPGADTPEFQGTFHRAVHRASSALAGAVYRHLLEQPVAEGKQPVVDFITGPTGAGKGTIRQHAAMADALAESDIIVDGPLSGLWNAQHRIQAALDSGRSVHVVYVHWDPVDAWHKGVVTRTATEGRQTPLDYHVQSHVEGLETIKKLVDAYGDHPKVSIEIIRNRTHEEPESISVADLPEAYNEGDVRAAIEAHRPAESEVAAARDTRAEGDKRRDAGAPRDVGQKPQSQPEVASARSALPTGRVARFPTREDAVQATEEELLAVLRDGQQPDVVRRYAADELEVRGIDAEAARKQSILGPKHVAPTMPRGVKATQASTPVTPTPEPTKTATPVTPVRRTKDAPPTIKNPRSLNEAFLAALKPFKGSDGEWYYVDTRQPDFRNVTKLDDDGFPAKVRGFYPGSGFYGDDIPGVTFKGSYKRPEGAGEIEPTSPTEAEYDAKRSGPSFMDRAKERRESISAEDLHGSIEIEADDAGIAHLPTVEEIGQWTTAQRRQIVDAFETIDDYGEFQRTLKSLVEQFSRQSTPITPITAASPGEPTSAAAANARGVDVFVRNGVTHIRSWDAKLWNGFETRDQVEQRITALTREMKRLEPNDDPVDANRRQQMEAEQDRLYAELDRFDAKAPVTPVTTAKPIASKDTPITPAEGSKPPREFSSTQVELPHAVSGKIAALAAEIPDADLAEDADRAAVEVSRILSATPEKPVVPKKKTTAAAVKTYASDRHAKPHEVLEDDYLAHKRAGQIRNYERGIADEEAALAKLGPKATTSRQKHEVTIAGWKARLQELKTGTRDDARWREEYAKAVKTAISKGLAVPADVIAQRPEFTKAVDARARYDKGRHTSFANKSVAVDSRTVAEYGIKVKRQDGSAITDDQVNHITTGIREVEKAVGPLGDILRALDQTVAHTNGKFPFMRGDAGGLYSPDERTITVGIADLRGRPIRALAHEVGHLLDISAGAAMGVSARVHGASRSYDSHSLAEVDSAAASVIREATGRINDTTEVRRLVKAEIGKQETPEQKADIQRAKVQLGPYWRSPREVFARLFEQYVADEHGVRTESADSPQAYRRQPGWWTEEVFATLKPKIRAAIDERLAILREKHGLPSSGGSTGRAHTPVPATSKVAHSSTAAPRGGRTSVTLQATVVPGAKEFIDQDVAPIVEEAGRQLNEARKDVRALFAPDTVGEGSRLFADVLRAGLAAHAQRVQRAQHVLRVMEKAFDRRSNDDNLAFMDAIEGGQIEDLPEPLREAATQLRDLLTHKRAEVQKRGKLQSYIANYFPHEWKQPTKAKDLIRRILGKRPLQGPKTFLKKRSIPTVAEGIALGLEPASYNPVTLVLHKLAEMDKWIMAHDVLKESKALGVAKFVRAGAAPPDGWQRYHDSFGTVYAPPFVKVDEAFDARLMDKLHEFATALGITAVRKVKIAQKGSGVGSTAWGYAIANPDGSNARVATKFAGPETVLEHEIGHVLDWKYGLWDKISRELDDEQFDASERHHARELRDLADKRFEGESDVKPSFRAYVRKKEEKIANLVHAFIYNPALAKEVAPNAYWALYNLAKDNPELTPLIDLQKTKSLVLGTNTTEQRVNGTVIAGHYYGPPDATRILNNYLSPGLRGNPAFDAYRTAGNFLNQVQLGLSGFHLTMTGIEAMVSKLAQGIEEVSRGEFGHAGKTIAEAPVATLTTLFKGNRALKDLYARDANLHTVAGVADLVAQAGGGVHRDKTMRAYEDRVEATLRALRQGNVIGAAVRVPAALFELPTKFVMEWWVPRLKLGAFLDMARMELRTLGPEPSLADVRRVLGGVQDSIDNRFGQLVYDNLFWHNALKDAGMGAVRALGWNVGTIREVFGAPTGQAKHLLNRPTRLRDTGERGEEGTPVYTRDKDPWLTHKAAYVVALAVGIGLISALYEYLHTGERPKELRDLAFPRTGGKRPDGKDERVSFPSYFKDVYAFFHDLPTSATETVGHKLQPLLNLLYETWSNEDYYGTEIRNADDPLVQQLQDYVTFLGEQVKPISLRSFDQRRQDRGETGISGAESFFGVTPAPASVYRSRAEERMRKYLPQQGRTKREAEASQTKRDLKEAVRNEDRAAAEAALATGELSRRQVEGAVRTSRLTPLQAGFQRLTLDQALKVWGVATPEERATVRSLLQRKAESALENAPPADVPGLVQRVKAALSMPISGGVPVTQRPAVSTGRTPVTAR